MVSLRYDDITRHATSHDCDIARYILNIPFDALIGMADNDNFTGNYKKNPYNFEFLYRYSSMHREKSAEMKELL